jgi:hypothetical protein
MPWIQVHPQSQYSEQGWLPLVQRCAGLLTMAWGYYDKRTYLEVMTCVQKDNGAVVNGTAESFKCQHKIQQDKFS